MEYKKICIVGSQGVGKTTLTNLLSTKLKIPVISEIARNFTKEQLQCTNIEYPNIQKRILELQLLEESKYDSFISDRGSIDNLAYFLYSCYDISSDLDNSFYVSQSINNALNYTHIFFLRPEWELVDDGFRDCDVNYQKSIDIIIKTILQLYNIKYYMLSGTIENRMKKAMEIIKR